MSYEDCFDAVIARAESAGLSKSALMRAIGEPRPKLYLYREAPEKAKFEAIEAIIERAGSPQGEADDLRIAWYSARRMRGANAADFAHLVNWANRNLKVAARRELLLGMARAYADNVRRKNEGR